MGTRCGRRWGAKLSVAVLLGAAIAIPGHSPACPSCSSLQMTLTETIQNADVAALAVLVERGGDRAANEAAINGANGAAPADPFLNPVTEESTFRVERFLKGGEKFEANHVFQSLYLGAHPDGTRFLVTAVLDEKKRPSWSTPTGLSDASFEYLTKLLDAPPKGADRLAYFEPYLGNADRVVSSDAYEEFAKAPFADLRDLKPKMRREQLLAWLADPAIDAIHRRLYLTMLGICGLPEDVPLVEGMIKSQDPKGRMALDALLACYLNLKGVEGVPLIEELFLGNDKAEYTDTYSAIMAIRIHDQEGGAVPRDRLKKALRLVLERPSLADMVISDLQRWQDWEVMDRLVELFKSADDKSAWVRVPVVNYLRACPLPEAAKKLEELKRIDPEAVRRASQFFAPTVAATPKTSDPTTPQETDVGPDGEPPVALDESEGGDESGDPTVTADANTASEDEADSVTADTTTGETPNTAAKAADQGEKLASKDSGPAPETKALKSSSAVTAPPKTAPPKTTTPASESESKPWSAVQIALVVGAAAGSLFVTLKLLFTGGRRRSPAS